MTLEVLKESRSDFEDVCKNGPGESGQIMHFDQGLRLRSVQPGSVVQGGWSKVEVKRVLSQWDGA